VRAGSANERLARQVFRKATIKLIVAEAQPATIMEIASKRVDAGFIALLTPQNFLSKNPQIKLKKVGGEAMFPAAVTWALPLGEYHFQQYLNAFLEDVKSRGDLEQLEQQWLGALK